MSLDQSIAARGMPPGSMRFFATLFSPAAKREVLTALYVIESEVSDAARATSHEVAHSRLAWWRSEIERLLAGNPQHPATRALVPMLNLVDHRLDSLHDLLGATDMDLACVSYSTELELAAYCARSGGTLQVLATRWLAAPTALDQALEQRARRYGTGVRQVEIVRDLHRDLLQGRLYVPLETLRARQLTAEDLRSIGARRGLATLLTDWQRSIEREYLHEQQPDSPRSSALVHSRVLAALHARLLARIARRGHDVMHERVELGPFDKLWTAWRAARRALPSSTAG